MLEIFLVVGMITCTVILGISLAVMIDVELTLRKVSTVLSHVERRTRPARVYSPSTESKERAPEERMLSSPAGANLSTYV